MEAELDVVLAHVSMQEVRTFGDLVTAAVDRVFRLDPYGLEVLLKDARRAAPGTLLELTTDVRAARALLGRVRRRLGPSGRAKATR